jgi:hypothetical protein
MGQSELFTGPGTSDRMKKIAESLPPYDLLKAYRDAVAHFHTTDVVLVVVPGEFEGFVAQPRTAYLEKALKHWTEKHRAVLPIANESAHKRLMLPAEQPAFWLAVESPQDGAVGHVAIGSMFRTTLEEASLS